MIDRGQSNTLGFILLFTVVLSSIGIVATAGVDSLESGRQTATLQSVGQSFKALAEAAEDIHRENVSVRTTQMRLGNGRLQPGRATTMTVERGGTTLRSVTTTPIAFNLSEHQVVYSLTGVFRQQPGGGSAVLRRPDYRLDTTSSDEVLILPLVVTSRASGTPTTLSGGEAQVYLTRASASTTVYDGFAATGETITVTVDTRPGRTQAWEQALESVSSASDSCSQPTGSTVECTYGVDDTSTLILRRVNVDFEFAG